MHAASSVSAPDPPTPMPKYSKGALRAKVESLESSLLFLRGRLRDVPEGVSSVDQLLARLARAKACIIRDGRMLRRSTDSSLFWMHVHEVAADMLLLLPVDMLAAEALSVEAHFRRNIHEPVARATWLGADEKSGPLCQAVLHVTRHAQRDDLKPDKRLAHDRNLLRGALRMVNKQADRYLRQLSLNMLLRSLSGGLLLLSFGLTYVFSLPKALTDFLQAETLAFPGLAILALSLLGAGGAIVANMLSEHPVLDLNGARWRQFAYQLFIKPSIGAFAAFLFYLLAQSQILFLIESPHSPPAPASSSALMARLGSVATPAAPVAPPEIQPPVRITLGNEKALICAYVLLFIAVGFSAEKFLGPAMDKVLNKLFYTAEKNTRSPGMDTAPPPGAVGQLPGAFLEERHDE
ncbi:hypothetical protein [Archangium sp.]|uniref:hypothetical protein n=1 Tax=Archangium sp. TaxID=1872627 RepID=UPI00286A0466|nr:hypothetical protein [Archangium sp.]